MLGSFSHTVWNPDKFYPAKKHLPRILYIMTGSLYVDERDGNVLIKNIPFLYLFVCFLLQPWKVNVWSQCVLIDKPKFTKSEPLSNSDF